MGKTIYQKGIPVKVSNNFKSTEFDCKGGGCCTTTTIDDSLISLLQAIRDHFGKAVTINSGYRCAAHNQKVGGAKKSRHVFGEASDIKVKGVEPIEVAKYAEKIGVLGIGLYSWGCHVDTRTSKFFWRTDKQIPVDTFLESEEKPFLPLLKNGDKGESVKSLQTLLKSKGVKDAKGRTLSADGIFGNNTEYAVKSCQSKHGLFVTGIVDDITWKVIITEE